MISKEIEMLQGDTTAIDQEQTFLVNLSELNSSKEIEIRGIKIIIPQFPKKSKFPAVLSEFLKLQDPNVKKIRAITIVATPEMKNFSLLYNLSLDIDDPNYLTFITNSPRMKNAIINNNRITIKNVISAHTLFFKDFISHIDSMQMLKESKAFTEPQILTISDNQPIHKKRKNRSKAELLVIYANLHKIVSEQQQTKTDIVTDVSYNSELDTGFPQNLPDKETNNLLDNLCNQSTAEQLFFQAFINHQRQENTNNSKMQKH